MVPSSNLIRGFLALVPFTVIAIAFGGPGQILIAATCAVAILVALLDLWQSRHRLHALTLTPRSPARLTRHQEGTIHLTFAGPRTRPLQIRFGLPLPPSVETADQPASLLLPAGDTPVTVSVLATPRRRGRWEIAQAFLEAPSHWHLWDIRRTIAIDLQLQVYANLSRDRKGLGNILLRRQQVGAHAIRQLGKGREFEQLREYIPGDGYEDIHWKATAKRNAPVTKLFRLERTQDIAVVLDHSRLSAKHLSGNGESGDTALERMIQATLLLFLAAEQQGDRFALVTFSRKVTHLIRAATGITHLQRCQDALYQLQPDRGSPDYDEVFTRLRTHFRRRTLLLFLTDLGDPLLEEIFQERLPLVSRHHLVLVHSIRNPDASPVFGKHPPHDLDGVYRRLAGHLEWDRLRLLQRRLRNQGISFETATEEAFTVELVNRYLKIKSRQLL